MFRVLHVLQAVDCCLIMLVAVLFVQAVSGDVTICEKHLRAGIESVMMHGSHSVANTRYHTSGGYMIAK